MSGKDLRHNRHAAPDRIPRSLDYLVANARALPGDYGNGEHDEDSARERLGGFGLWVTTNDAKYRHLKPQVETEIARGRRGDERADAAVERGCAELIAEAEETRSLWGECRRYFLRKLEAVQTAVGVRVASPTA